MNITGFYFTILRNDYGKVYVCLDDVLLLTFEVKKTKDGRNFLTSPSIKKTRENKEYYERFIKIIDEAAYKKISEKIITAFQTNTKSLIPNEAINFKKFIDNLTKNYTQPKQQESTEEF